ncbi:polysaccharide biosynthesis tyrosine autokinase [Luteolibacter marinus]|uniref:polysaccharide biosynthesis tyrosine autokinase n=1 Tax=Luteolibacter marinus TaxID=2776705 RepID=UPI0018682F19|nr:polysaccharide biosynthesis tyrosine autokinase [Luteolibacter marinus]
MSRLPAYPQSFEDEFEEDDYSEGPKRQDSNLKLKRLLLDLVGRWYWPAFGLVLGFLAAGYYLSKAPKQYTATSTLLIKQQTASVMSRDQVEEIDMRSQEGMNTVAARIQRLDLLERVASRQDVRELPGLMPAPVDWTPEWVKDKLGKADATADAAPRTGATPPPPAVLGGMIGGWMEISIRKFTRLMDISITHPVPEVSKALADAVAREYLAEIANARTEGRTSSIDLLQKESDEARNSLQVARSALATYARALEAHKALDIKETEVAVLQRRYLPAHPKMIAATAELDRLKERFIREFDVARSAPSDKSYWDGTAKEFSEHADRSDDYLRAARQHLLARIGVLESEIQSSTSVFNSMLTRLEESSVNQESEESSAEVSSLARVPGGPSGPVAKKIYTSGIAGGFACGLLIAFLFVRLDNKFHTVAQIAAETDTTVLAAISDIHPRHLAVAEKQYYKRHPDDTRDHHDDWDERLVFRPGTASTSYAEMYRVLRASVSLLGDETKRKITLFSSALPGEGKTSTSANFALAAAGQGRKTLLIDLDLRKPSVHRSFGMEREREKGGITECLANIAPFHDVIVRDTGEENLHLILSGKRAPNPGELLDITRLKAILAQACREYDVVVLDTAPLLAVPDTRIIAPLAHNVCLVARAEYAPKGAIRRVLEVLDEDGTKLSGIVFNGFKEKRRLMGENYSYGYYKTSRYGRAYRYGYGAYGAYGEDDQDDKPRKNKRKKRRRSV